MDNERIQKVKTYYYSGVRKIFNKRVIREMNFDDKIQVLSCLPPVEGSAFSSQKSLHYLLLNDLLTYDIENWSLLTKNGIFNLVERCCEMSKCRDLNNKLRVVLF